MDKVLDANEANLVAYVTTVPTTAFLPLPSFCKYARTMVAKMKGCFTHSAFAYSSKSLVASIMPKRIMGAVPSETMVCTLRVVSKIDVVYVSILFPQTLAGANPIVINHL